MRHSAASVVVLGLVLIAPTIDTIERTCAAADSPVVRSLGEPPLCEPSAAIPVPWKAGDVLVADNEVEENLFQFSLSAGQLVRQRKIPLPAAIGPSDVEALAVAKDLIWVVGSHSRNKRCEYKEDRMRIIAVRQDESGSRFVPARVLDTRRVWRAATASVDACLGTLFVDPSPKLAREVCGAIVLAEKQARVGERCSTFNIEGAVGVAGEQLWLGLRAPLVDGAAVLLRLAPPMDALRFDGVALVDLGGSGIRELALRESVLWGIAGPVGEDSGVAFRIWREPASLLVPGSRVAPRLLRVDVPPSSEGMAFDGDRLITVIDGDRGVKGARTCLVPAKQATIGAATSF